MHLYLTHPNTMRACPDAKKQRPTVPGTNQVGTGIGDIRSEWKGRRTQIEERAETADAQHACSSHARMQGIGGETRKETADRQMTL